MEIKTDTDNTSRTLRERLKTGHAVTNINCNVSLKIPTVPGLGRTALKDMPPSNKDQRGEYISRLKRKAKKQPVGRPKKAKHPSSSRLQNGRSHNYGNIVRPSRASYRLHLKTHSPEKKEKRINNTSISRTVELIKTPIERGEISSKLLFMASLNLCPKPGFIIAPHILVTPADPALVEKIKIRQERERKERHRKTHQERMARLISIKNRGRLYPPKPIELIDLASDDESKALKKPVKPPQQLNHPKGLNSQYLSQMLQSPVPVVNHTNSNYPSFNLNPAYPMLKQNSLHNIPNPNSNEEDPEIIIEDPPCIATESGKILSNLVMQQDSGVLMTGLCEITAINSQDAAEECPDFILGDLHTDVNEDESPDGNNNLNDSFSFADESSDDFNPQDFVAAHYGITEEDIILID